MTELVKKFYVEVSNHFSDKSVDFAIVYGTVGKKLFKKKNQDNIVGKAWDINIPLDSPNLFDDFDKAVKRFFFVSENGRKHLQREIDELWEREQQLQDLLDSMEEK